MKKQNYQIYYVSFLSANSKNLMYFFRITTFSGMSNILLNETGRQ